MPDQPTSPTPSKPRGRKNIVICCDGTGNEFGGENSNVVKLYTALCVDNEQVVYYHPGVGTMGAPNARNRLERKWSVLKGLAFGAGFRDNVFDAYRFLMDNYDDNGGDPDHVYLFGFSRGAYTIRALSGLLHGYGLLCRGNEGHLPYAWRMFTDQVKDIGDTESKGPAERHSVLPQFAFQETFSHPNFKIHFIGLWDTVSSVGWVTTPLRLLYTAQNPIVETGRHAVSIDERRCFYRDNLWGQPLEGQDILQVWFAGVHSDIGGSYPQPESALANISLNWILEEARKAGIRTSLDRENLIFGRPTEKDYAAALLYRTPEPYWEVHKSLHGPWWPLEFLPHRYYNKATRKESWRIPLGVPRHIPPDSIIHPSVIDRMKEHPYHPPNLLESDVTPLQGPIPGTKADLSGFYVYKPDASAGHETSPLKAAAGAAAAVAILGAIFIARRLF